MLTDAAISTFRDRGLLRLEQAVPGDLLAKTQAVVRAVMARQGLWRDGAWRLDAVEPKPWPRVSKVPGSKTRFRGAFDELLTPDLMDEVTRLVGDRDLWGSSWYQLLFTPPNAEQWTVPSKFWHTDAPHLASGCCPGVKIFTLPEPTQPGGGATLAVAGSHRLFNPGRFIPSRDVTNRLRNEPCFQDLFRADLPDRERLVGPIGRAANVEMEVVELTGRAGDIWLMDPRLMHAPAPNAGATPRLVVGQMLMPKLVMHQIQERYAPEAAA